MTEPQNENPDLAERALQWIVRLNSGTTSDGEVAAYEAWKRESTAHADAALEAEQLWAVMGKLFVDRKSGRVLAAAPSKSGMSRRGALSLLLCLGAVGTSGALWSSGLVRRMAADYTTETASPELITLPDGSRAYLNARSALDVDFTEQMRRVRLLAGQAYFEVNSDAARPFEVMVDDTSFRALGTAFDVARDLPGARAELSVTQHSVRVGSGLGETLVVQEGEILRVDRQGHIGQAIKADVSTFASWRDGQYVAEGRSLEEVVAALAAWHRGFIVITDAKLKQLKVNAVLDLRDANGSLDALQGGLPLTVRHISDYFAVISAP
ncbi:MULTISPECIES: FecR family protein [unclassified Rhizobium]|uniref:FecR family protein n=1 Tax=Rhizobium sp. 16-488-2b TaxID=2819991 RepID=UPI001ADAAEE7|nr:FecR domain-containing protein [Rhizobium sp. 16-488-2b]MBO9127809.1 FecR domain-containing protein [Rhizobium sp. 16-488-2b]